MEQTQTPLTDLIELSKQGDPEAQEALVLETQNKVYYHCKKFLKNDQDAQDATQDVLIAMLTKLDTLREPAAFWGWLNRITANRCKELLTRGVKEWQIPEDEDGGSMLDDMETLDDQTVPDKAMDNAETQRLILDIIDGLSPEQRMTVTFFYYDEMSVKDIAATMEVSEGTVKSRLNYARKSIKEGVEKLAKQGTKLYGLSPLPFLAYFLRRGAESQILSPAAASAITQGALAGAGTTAATAATAAATGAGTAAAGATGAAGTGTATAATAVGAKAAGAVSTKIVAAALAGTLAVGGVGTGVYMATRPAPTPTPAPEPAPVVAVVAPTPAPSAELVLEPTAEPSEEPSAEPSQEPSEEPSPTPSPSEEPSEEPSPSPSATPEPTPEPTPSPTPTPGPGEPYFTTSYREDYADGGWREIAVSGGSLSYSMCIYGEGSDEDTYEVAFDSYTSRDALVPGQTYSGTIPVTAGNLPAYDPSGDDSSGLLVFLRANQKATGASQSWQKARTVGVLSDGGGLTLRVWPR